MVTSFTPRLSLTRMRRGNDGNRKCRHAVLFNIVANNATFGTLPTQFKFANRYLVLAGQTPLLVRRVAPVAADDCKGV
jgi:hypothetical protein